MNYDEYVAKDEDMLKKHNNIYISDTQNEILKKYDINVDDYNDVSSLIRDIEEILNYELYEDLDWVSQTLSEYNYYNNTNK